MAAGNPIFAQLQEQHGAQGLKIKTSELHSYKGGMYRRGYRVVVRKKGSLVSIIDVVKR